MDRIEKALEKIRKDSKCKAARNYCCFGPIDPTGPTGPTGSTGSTGPTGATESV